MSESKQKTRNQPSRDSQQSNRRGLYIGTIVVLVIIVITFIGAPLIGITSGEQGRLVFGTYNGKEIDYRPGNYFATAYEYMAEQLRSSNTDYDDNMFQFQLRMAWRNAYDMTIEHVATLALAELSKANVSEEAIERSIIKNPRFQENGKFSVELYRNVNNQEMFSIRNLNREFLIAEQIRTDLLENVLISEQEKEFASTLLGEKRIFNLVIFPLDEYPDKQVEVYALENKNLFRSADFSRITVQNIDTASTIHQQILNEEASFDDLARLHSLDQFAEQGGVASRIYAYELESLLEEEDQENLFSLRKDEYSPIFTTKDSQYVIFKLDSDPQVLQENVSEDLLPEIRNYIQSENPDEIETYMLELSTNFRAQALELGLKKAAQTYNKEVFTTNPVRVDYGNALENNTEEFNKDIPDLTSIAFHQDLYEMLFMLEMGNSSEPYLLQDTFIIAELKEIIATEEEEKKSAMNIYPSQTRDILRSYFRDAVINEDKLLDNFTETFERYIMQPDIPEADETDDSKESAAS